ncbi:hypothetical protein DOTSEDRAFT_82667 [Dothistroma septosporum NZE10]|uniref:Uncharacterized protein n=1 Tax=Dothistroma septosporum (strain NZE10 / CBS 128990) TaxID=675120 RepID=N1PCX1_DOTSN|nr:hypothetical protein DOTSEDRAFT_82667 [Dothistroma septosporum NZE10]
MLSLMVAQITSQISCCVTWNHDVIKCPLCLCCIVKVRHEQYRTNRIAGNVETLESRQPIALLTIASMDTACARPAAISSLTSTVAPLPHSSFTHPYYATTLSLDDRRNRTFHQNRLSRLLHPASLLHFPHKRQDFLRHLLQRPPLLDLLIRQHENVEVDLELPQSVEQKHKLRRVLEPAHLGISWVKSGATDLAKKRLQVGHAAEYKSVAAVEDCGGFIVHGLTGGQNGREKESVLLIFSMGAAEEFEAMA